VATKRPVRTTSFIPRKTEDRPAPAPAATRTPKKEAAFIAPKVPVTKAKAAKAKIREQKETSPTLKVPAPVAVIASPDVTSLREAAARGAKANISFVPKPLQVPAVPAPTARSLIGASIIKSIGEGLRYTPLGAGLRLLANVTGLNDEIKDIYQRAGVPGLNEYYQGQIERTFQPLTEQFLGFARLTEMYQGVIENLPDWMKTPTGAVKGGVGGALTYAATNLGMQVGLQISKVPERLLYLASVYLPSAPKAHLTRDFLREEGRLPTREEMDGLVEGWERNTWERRDRFEDFIFDPETDELIPERLMGRFQSPFSTFEQATLGNYGVTGLGWTFLFDPDVEKAFFEAANADLDRPLIELIQEHENVGVEFIMTTLTDPMWLVPVAKAGTAWAQMTRAQRAGRVIARVVFPPGFVVEPIAAKILGLWSRSSVRRGLVGLGNRSRVIIWGNNIEDVMNNVALRYDPKVHGPLYSVTEGPEGLLQGMLRTPETFMEGLLSKRQRRVLLFAAELIGERDLTNVEKLLRTHGPFADGPRSGAFRALQELTDAPEDVLRALKWVSQAAESVYAEKLGVSLYPRGALRRTISWFQRLLVENWLWPNPRYHMVNGVSDTNRMIVAGYLPDPFNFDAAADVTRYLGKEYGIALPTEVAQSILLDALDDGGMRLATSEVPWPVGDEASIKKLWELVTNKKVPEGLATFLDESAFTWLLRNVNYAKIVKAGAAAGRALESSRRATIFIQAFKTLVEGEGGVRQRLVRGVAGDPDAPVGLLSRIKSGAIKTMEDFEHDITRIRARVLPGESIAFDRPPSVPDNQLTTQVEKALDDLQRQYLGNLDNPLFQRRATQAFQKAAETAEVLAQKAIKAVEEVTELPEEVLARLKRTDAVLDVVGDTEVFTDAAGTTIYWGKALQEALAADSEMTAVIHAGKAYGSSVGHGATKVALQGKLGAETGSLWQYWRTEEGAYLVSTRELLQQGSVAYAKGLREAAQAMLDAGIPPGTVATYVPFSGEEAPFAKATLGALAADPEIFKGDLDLSTALPPDLRLQLKELALEVGEIGEGVRALFSRGYTLKQLNKAAGGLEPDNALMKVLFQDLPDEAMAALAESYLENPDGLTAGLRQFYQDSVASYNMRYGSAIKRAEAIPQPIAVPFFAPKGSTPQQLSAVLQEFSQEWTSQGVRDSNLIKGVFVVDTGELGLGRGFHNLGAEAIKFRGSLSTQTVKISIGPGAQNQGYAVLMEGRLDAVREAARALQSSGLSANTFVLIPGLKFRGTLADLMAPAAPQPRPPSPEVPELTMRAPELRQWRISNFSTKPTKGAANWGSDLADFLEQIQGLKPDLGRTTGICSRAGAGESGIWWAKTAPGHQPHKLAAGVSLVGDSIDFIVEPEGRIIASVPTSYEDALAFTRELLRVGVHEGTVIKFIWSGVETPYAEVSTDSLLGQFAREEYEIDVDTSIWDQALADYRKMEVGRITDELAKIRAGFDDWFQSFKEVAERNAASINLSKKQVEQGVAAVRKWQQWMADEYDRATVKAAAEVHSILFDYVSKLNPEQLLRNYTPFSTYQLRNPVFWAQVFSNSPSLPGLAYRSWRAMEKERKKRNLTSRFQGTLGFETAGAGPFPEGYYAFDVRSMLDVFGQFRQPFESPLEGQKPTGWQGAVRWMVDLGKWTGIRPWPYIDIGLQELGVLPREGMGELFGPVQRFLEAYLRETGELPPGGRTATGQWIFEYLTRRRVAEMEAEGEITHLQALEAMAHTAGPIWDQAQDFVVGQQNRLMLLSFFLPAGVKYASPGELRIREQQAELAPGVERAAYPYLETYGLALGNDPVRTQAALIYEQYEQLLRGLNPAGAEYKQLVQERQQKLAQIDALREKVGYHPESLETLGMYDIDFDRPTLLRALSDWQPNVSQFTNEQTGRVDWDGYWAAVDEFNERIPELSMMFGEPIEAEDWFAYRDRFKTAIQVAYQFHREKINAYWDQYESIQPGGANFERLSTDYVTSKYEEALASGMKPMDAQLYAADLWADILARGLPYDAETGFMGAALNAVEAQTYSSRVASRLGIDWRDAYWQLQAYDFPGMFGDQGNPEDLMRNYYFNLTPSEQREVRKAVGYPEGEDAGFNAWWGRLSPVEQQRTWQDVAIRLKDERLAKTMRVGLLKGGLGEYTLPPGDLLTPQERQELAQVERDWFIYSLHSAGLTDTPGPWTPLMEKYYGDSQSGESRFWDTLNKYVLTRAATEDPIMASAMDRISRGTFDFTDEQWMAVVDYFNQNLDLFVDEEATQRIQSHPDWVEQAGLERAGVIGARDPKMEDLRAQYYNVYYEQREEWEKSNPEEWAALRPYLATQEAAELAYPYYLYVYKDWVYEKWYGTARPDQVEAKAASLAKRYAQVLEDYNNWFYHDGPWTYLLENFVGPTPERIQIQSSQAPEEGEAPPPRQQQATPTPTPPPEGEAPPPPPTYPTSPLPSPRGRGAAGGRVSERPRRTVTDVQTFTQPPPDEDPYADEAWQNIVQPLVRLTSGAAYTKGKTALDVSLEKMRQVFPGVKEGFYRNVQIVWEIPELEEIGFGGFAFTKRELLRPEQTLTRGARPHIRESPTVIQIQDIEDLATLLHEGAHQADLQGPQGRRVSSSPAFRAAVEQVLQEALRGATSRLGTLVRHFPGIGGNEWGHPTEDTSWGGYVELYASLMAASLGDLSEIPEPLQPFFKNYLEDVPPRVQPQQVLPAQALGEVEGILGERTSYIVGEHLGVDQQSGDLTISDEALAEIRRRAQELGLDPETTVEDILRILGIDF